jgi:hypothetical protein
MVISLCLVLFSVAMVVAQDKGSSTANAANVSNGSTAPNGSGDSDAKTLSGMSVLGNNEAPMSLFIVPWKSSELGVETNLHRTLDEHDVPVDRDVFMRELDYYQVSAGSKNSTLAAVSQTLK